MEKPQILDFMSDSDIEYLYSMLDKYQSSTITKYQFYKELNAKEYPYEKYEWSVCLQCLRKFDIYKKSILKNVEEWKEAGITHCKLICHNDCECCKKILDKPRPIKDIFELPRKECDYDTQICTGATWQAVIDFESPEEINELQKENNDSKTVLILLCLLLGGFGAHRFYLKKNKTAIIMGLIGITSLIKSLSFSWIAGLIIFLWVILDLILIINNKLKKTHIDNSL